MCYLELFHRKRLHNIAERAIQYAYERSYCEMLQRFDLLACNTKQGSTAPSSDLIKVRIRYDNVVYGGHASESNTVCLVFN